MLRRKFSCTCLTNHQITITFIILYFGHHAITEAVLLFLSYKEFAHTLILSVFVATPHSNSGRLTQRSGWLGTFLRERELGQHGADRGETGQDLEKERLWDGSRDFTPKGKCRNLQEKSRMLGEKIRKSHGLCSWMLRSFSPLLLDHVFLIDHIDAKHNTTVGTFWAPRGEF